MKTTQQINKEIEKRNKIFRNASLAEKRILVAKDVIQLIEREVIVPRPGCWVLIDGDNLSHLTNELATESLQKIVCSDEIECECCALGSILLSGVAFKNRVTIDDFKNDQLEYCFIASGDRVDKTGMKKLFGLHQFQLIELAYEGGDGYYKQYNFPDHISTNCINFYQQYSSSKARLIGIMQNIIANEGTFIP